MALKAVSSGKWQTAQQLAKRSSDPVVKNIVSWAYLQDKSRPANFHMISSFLNKANNWPKQRALELRAEKDFPDIISSKKTIEWFSKHKPQTEKGLVKYIDALLSTGNSSMAKSELSKLWNNINLDSTSNVVKKYGHLISKQSHAKRLDSLIWAGRYGDALAILPYAPRNDALVGKARISLAKRSKNVDADLARVPKHLKADPALLYERAKWRRKKYINSGAVELLNSISSLGDKNKLMWRERHIIARRYIEDRNYRAAYNIASKHKQNTGFAEIQAEWVSGWLALRFLKNPKRAAQHFSKINSKATSPLSLSRAQYWLGRSYEAMGNKAQASNYYAQAAQYPTTFYGQYAMKKNGIRPASFSNKRVSPNPEKLTNFRKDEMVRVIYFLKSAGLSEYVDPFYWKLYSNAKTADDYALIAHTATKLGHTHHGVFTAKKTMSKNKVLLMNEGYPILNNVPRAPEKALIHSLIRQESNFDLDAHSPAGARGLMQLMPATAKEVARKKGMIPNTARLSTDAKYNVTLGSSYLKQMLDRYNNSYPLAIAAYNAGPGRSDKWKVKFGDPKNMSDENFIDWSESLPIYETRNYVQRVMEGMHVYRSKFGSAR